MKYIQKLKKSILVGVLATALFFGNAGQIQVAYANDPAPAGTPTTDDTAPCGGAGQISCALKGDIEQQFGKDVANALSTAALLTSLGLKYLYTLLIPLLAIIGKFMSNDWVTGNVLNVDIMIEVAWSYIRNMVNIAMMFYLLYIAAQSILNSYGGKAPNIPETLRSVALVLILVNFSMLFCRTIINISGVATTAAFSIPRQTGTIFDQNTNGFFPFIWASSLGTKKSSANGANGDIRNYSGSGESMYALECVHQNYAMSLKSMDLNGKSGNILIANPVQDRDGNNTTAWYHNYRLLLTKAELDNPDTFKEKVEMLKKNATATTFVDSEEKFINGGDANAGDYPYYKDCITDWNNMFFSSKNAMFLFAFNLMKIGEYENGLGNISSFSDLLARVVTSFVYLFAFFAVIVALAIAVVIRGIMLWFFMVTSPIWITLQVLKKKDLAAFKDKIGTMESFINLAFMPAILGFVLSITFIMLNYLKYIGKLEGADKGFLSLGGLNLYYDASNPFVSGLNSMFDIMIAMITVVAMWAAVKMAFDFGFNKSGFFYKKLYEPTVGKVLDTAGKIGSFAGNLPFTAPIIPVGGGKKLSFSGLSKLPDRKIDAMLEPYRSNDDKVIGDLINHDAVRKIDPVKARDLSTSFKTDLVTSASDIDKFKKHMSVLSPTTETKERQATVNFVKELMDGKNTRTSSLEFNVDDNNKVSIGKDAANKIYSDKILNKTPVIEALNRIINYGVTDPLDNRISKGDWQVAESIFKDPATPDQFTAIADNGDIKFGTGAPIKPLSSLATTNQYRGDIPKLKTDLEASFTGATSPNALLAQIQSSSHRGLEDALKEIAKAMKAKKPTLELDDIIKVFGISNPQAKQPKIAELLEIFKRY